MAKVSDSNPSREPSDLVKQFEGLRTASDVADLLEVPRGYLVHILYAERAKYPYRRFTIRKKSGKPRTISAPPKPIKSLQSKLNKILQLVYPPKPPVHGFLPGRSILSNARTHVRKRYLLNIDLEDFFPCIHFGRVQGMFMKSPYNIPRPAATALAQICCDNRVLPQGAPTSPIVSNMVCAKLDGQLMALAKRHRCTYTRYCDDITFSTGTRRFPAALASVGKESLTLGDELVSIIEGNPFRVNSSKTRMQVPQQHQEVTGLTVNVFPNVPRKFVRQVRAMLHARGKYGLDLAQHDFDQKYDRRQRNPADSRPSFDQVLLGKLAFIKMVKGEADPVYRRLRHQLHEVFPELVEDVVELPTAGMPGDVSEVWKHWYAKYKDLVFQLVHRKDGNEGGGTAFGLRDGVLVTAAHCTVGEIFVTPPFADGEPVPTSLILPHERVAEGIDVAVLKAPLFRMPDGLTMPMREQHVQPGEEVAALGYPAIPTAQSSLMVAIGIVESATQDYSGKRQTIVVSIPTSGGMSGGPVIDRYGNLVGTVMERAYAKVPNGAPERPFNQVLPIHYLSDIIKNLT